MSDIVDQLKKADINRQSFLRNPTIRLNQFDKRHLPGKPETQAVVEAIYGYYPAFSPFLNKEIAVKTCENLKKIQDKDIRPLFETIPAGWNVDQDTKESWMRFILGRASFVATTFLRLSKIDPSYLQFKETVT